ncbi:hypothetical protein IKP13_02940, partial [bacterium]|nr:hypothetical protein [bacterium]
MFHEKLQKSKNRGIITIFRAAATFLAAREGAQCHRNDVTSLRRDVEWRAKRKNLTFDNFFLYSRPDGATVAQSVEQLIRNQQV